MKLEALDLVISTLREHERELDRIGERMNKIADRLNWYAVWLEMLLSPVEPI